MAKNGRFVYRDEKTREISFPLGGIGTGCIGLAGNGRLIDWEIFNKPNKGSLNGFSHFAIRAERKGEVLDARVLHGDFPKPYMGDYHRARFGSYGFGVSRDTMAGIPHFGETVFTGEFPVARVDYRHKTFPGRVAMTAFNPFIPLNPDDSGLPAAFFEIEVTNPTKHRLDYTIAGTLKNPTPSPNRNTATKKGGLTVLKLGTDGPEAGALEYGDLTLATDAADTAAQNYWFRGAWFDSLEIFWRDFTTPGALKQRDYDAAGAGDHATLSARISVRPGRTETVRFALAWSFPNCHNYWKNDGNKCACEKSGVPEIWKNYYATQFEDSATTAAYALKNWDRLRDETMRFKDALFASDMPDAAIDAVSANISILKSPTVLRLEDGTFYGWEGCHPSAGCCEGSCTHVWNYQQALPFLFPSLERSMREADYRYNLKDTGAMPFRLQLPLGVENNWGRPCADGQFGGVMKAYRDWKICGDTDWLRGLWPAIKASIEFAWSPKNPDKWDPEKSGVLTGSQHHTLDMELFGPNAWLTGFYLGALKAGAEMAEALGEPEKASEYRAIFERGAAWMDANLFNGEFYIQRIDLGDKSILEGFETGGAQGKASPVDLYWDAEHGEIKYQIAGGSGIDQVLPQWHADLYGLGDIYDAKKVKKALRAIYRHNFVGPMREFYNPCRLYCLDDEYGTVICAWPEGAEKPAIPVPYSQETMHGFEYSAGTHMIARGLVKEGMRVVKAVRDRYDGERRNPWNEFECGSNYARSMASYALLNVFSGLRFDMREGMLGFDPVRMDGGRFRCFWSVGAAWGEVRIAPKRVELRVLGGTLELRALELPFVGGKVASVKQGKRSRAFEMAGDGRIEFSSPVRIVAGKALEVGRK